jgi:hypothetical protein
MISFDRKAKGKLTAILYEDPMYYRPRARRLVSDFASGLAHLAPGYDQGFVEMERSLHPRDGRGMRTGKTAPSSQHDRFLCQRRKVEFAETGT